MSRSSTIAVVLAGLAVVIAATGTAVAVTTTKVNILDPSTPSRIAHVDSNGRLYTNLPTSTYSYSSLLNVSSSDNFVTTPTTANLALTSLTLSHPAQVAGVANTNLRVALFKTDSSSSSSCVPTAYTQLYAWNLEPGNDIALDLSTPMVIKPTGSTPFCLDLYAYTITGSAYGAGYYPFGSATWYVASGTYSGAATAATPQTPAQLRGQAEHPVR